METPSPDPFDDWLAEFDEKRRRQEATHERRQQAEKLFGVRWRGAEEVLDLLEVIWPRQSAGSEQSLRGAPTPQELSTADFAQNAETPRPKDQPTGEPRRLGKYEILLHKATGGMGVVYQARDTVLGRVVALKTIRSGVLAHSGEVQRFYDEARAIAQLAHPHIVPIYEFGELDGFHYFTMAFAEGGCLTPHVEEYVRKPPADAVVLLLKISRAVQVAHGRKIIHRDLKPGNILLDAAGEPWVSDFGLAKFLESDLDRTIPGTPIGTAGYMAPEQVRGQGEKFGPPTDVWALGVILYELLTGTKPFPGETRDAIYRQICEADPVPLRKLRSSVNKDLETIVQWCLQRQPEARYASAGELADDLNRWLSGQVIRARPRPWPIRSLRWLRRRWNWVALILAAPLLIFSAVAYETMRDRTPLVPEDLPRPQPEVPPPSPTAEEWSAHIKERFEADKQATLLGAVDAPKWSRFRRGAEHAKTTSSAEQAFTILASETILLELLSRAPAATFRLRGEVCQVNTLRGSATGFYLGQTPSISNGKNLMVFVRTTFHEKPAQGAPTFLRQILGTSWSDSLGQAESTHTHADKLGGKAELNPEHWRQIILNVDADKIVYQLDGQYEQSVTWDKVNQTIQKAIAIEANPLTTSGGKYPAPNKDTRLHSQGGLGIIVGDGTSRFRNIVVEFLQ